MSTVYIMDHIWVRNCMDEFLFADFRLKLTHEGQPLVNKLFLGNGGSSVLGCPNGLGPGIANLEEVLTDNDSDSCNALTPASLHRQQQKHYQSAFSNPASTSYNSVILNAPNSSSNNHFSHNNSLSSTSPVLQHLMQPYNSSPVATTTSVESMETTIPSSQIFLPTVTSTASPPNNVHTTFKPNISTKAVKVDQRSISNLVEKQQQNNSYNINGFGINGVTSNSNTIGRKKPMSSASNGNLCESRGTKIENAKGHHTLARLGVNNRQREELFLC